jgi:hypothetical protein
MKPTLIAVSDDTVRGWVGYKLGWRLISLLGVVKSFEVLRLLESRTTSEPAPHERGRRQFLKTMSGAVVAVSILSGLRPLGVSAGSLTQSSNGRILEGEELAPLLREARLNSEFQKITQRLEQEGFTTSILHSRGFTHDDGTVSLILLFANTKGSRDFGQIIYVQPPTGAARVSGSIYHYKTALSQEEWRNISSWDEVSKHLDITSLRLREGTILAGSLFNGTFNYTECMDRCFWDKVLFCCGPSAVACIGAGPGYLICLLAICNVCVWGANVYCPWACSQ